MVGRAREVRGGRWEVQEVGGGEVGEVEVGGGGGRGGGR